MPLFKAEHEKTCFEVRIMLGARIFKIKIKFKFAHLGYQGHGVKTPKNASTLTVEFHSVSVVLFHFTHCTAWIFVKFRLIALPIIKCLQIQACIYTQFVKCNLLKIFMKYNYYNCKLFK